MPRFARDGHNSGTYRGWPMQPQRWTYEIDVSGTGSDFKYPEGYYTGGVYRTKAGAHGALTSLRRAVERRGGSLAGGPGVVPIVLPDQAGGNGVVTAVASQIRLDGAVLGKRARSLASQARCSAPTSGLARDTSSC